MRKMLIVIVLTGFLTGCGLVTLTTTAIEASGNRGHLEKIEVGLAREEVQEQVGKPNKTEAFQRSDGKKILVWYYLTEGRSGFRSLGDSNYTPYVFENDILTGWGYTHLEKIKTQ